VVSFGTNESAQTHTHTDTHTHTRACARVCVRGRTAPGESPQSRQESDKPHIFCCGVLFVAVATVDVRDGSNGSRSRLSLKAVCRDARAHVIRGATRYSCGGSL
jgi:hypothetical protein